MSNEQKPLPVVGWVLVTGHGTAFSFKEPVHPAVPWTELALHAEAQAAIDCMETEISRQAARLMEKLDALRAERDEALADAKRLRESLAWALDFLALKGLGGGKHFDRRQRRNSGGGEAMTEQQITDERLKELRDQYDRRECMSPKGEPHIELDDVASALDELIERRAALPNMREVLVALGYIEKAAREVRNTTFVDGEMHVIRAALAAPGAETAAPSITETLRELKDSASKWHPLRDAPGAETAAPVDGASRVYQDDGAPAGEPQARPEVPAVTGLREGCNYFSAPDRVCNKCGHRHTSPAVVGAAINLIAAVDERQDTKEPPLKYTIPYGAVAELRTALRAEAQPDEAPAVPAGWSFEFATVRAQDGTYGGWQRKLSEHRPTMPEDSVRNLQPVYSAAAPTAPSINGTLRVLKGRS